MWRGVSKFWARAAPRWTAPITGELAGLEAGGSRAADRLLWLQSCFLSQKSAGESQNPRRRRSSSICSSPLAAFAFWARV